MTISFDSPFILAGDKTNKMTCAPSKDSDQPGHMPGWSTWKRFGSLDIHKAHSKDWSDWVDAQVYLSLHWAHIVFVGFDMVWLILVAQVL